MTALVKKNNLNIGKLFNRWRYSYHGQSVLNPFHVVALSTVAGLALIHTWYFLAFIPVEAVFGWLLPRSKLFRKAVDADRERREKEARQHLYEATVNSLSPEFRLEIERFVLLGAIITDRVGCDAEICFQLQDLIKRYLYLASVLTDYLLFREVIGDTIKEQSGNVDTRIYDARGDKRRLNLDAVSNIEKEMRDIRELMDLAYEYAIAPEVEESNVCHRFLEDLEENKEVVKSLVQTSFTKKMALLES